MKDAVWYVVAAVCWSVTVPIGILVPLSLRNAINLIWPVLGGSHQVLRTVDRFSLLFMGLGWLAFVPLSLLLYVLGVVKDKRR